jgi:hypothetical protein
MNRWKRADGPDSRAARSENALGEALYREGKAAEAEDHLVHGFLVLARDESEDPDSAQKARDRTARFYIERGQRDKLDALLRKTQPAALITSASKAP